MKTIFDGKAFASKKEGQLAKKVLLLRKHGVVPKLATVLIGENVASEKYIHMKKSAAQRIGADLDEYKVPSIKPFNQIVQLIKFLSNDPEIHGVMLQLPLPKSKVPYLNQFISAISPQKDVDGHQGTSEFLPATVRAVLAILNEADITQKKTVAVIGAKGTVGSRLVSHLEKEKFNVLTYDQKDYPKNNDRVTPLKATLAKADVVLSATGKEGLIIGDYIKQGAVVIDIGYPEGDVDFDSVKPKASFITPVPGGVGPVTVVSLLENLVEACQKQSNLVI